LNTENLKTLKIHKLTQAQYDRELEAGNIDETALYLTPDDSITVDLDNNDFEPGLPNKIDADSLGGTNAEDFATKAFVTNKIAEAQLGGGSSGDVDIDLSGLATKDDLASVQAEIPDVSAFQTAAQVQALINEALGVIENGTY
jgi:hypothetical protein